MAIAVDILGYFGIRYLRQPFILRSNLLHRGTPSSLSSSFPNTLTLLSQPANLNDQGQSEVVAIAASCVSEGQGRW